ncbi:hypothetical protein ARAM_002828 [Aspergillus rambellii]|uniref:RBR-type E3 ubiquitin transferase n=1 Tax=Aspergillus rambellii TaxID=308745 RepID=A0A0F8WAJ3_9EURO|nr:hypothetical protein ARAM_002828 [Aspergillus rambellii]
MEEYDLLIVADATYSMNDYLASLHISLPQIISISALTGCFSRIGIIAYRDYSDSRYLEFSGWMNQTPRVNHKAQPDLVAFARRIEARGGGDFPEAVKTALAKAYSEMRPNAQTLILLYTDAPPHTIDLDADAYDNAAREKNALSDPTSYKGAGPLFMDWVSATGTLATGEKRAQVFAVLECGMRPHTVPYYNFLCTRTGGACIMLDSSDPESISKTTVELLLSWMQVGKATLAEPAQTLRGQLCRYNSTKGIEDLKDDEDPKSRDFFPFPYSKPAPALNNTRKVKLNMAVVKESLPKKPTPALDPAERWSKDVAYQQSASQHLMRIIEEDIDAITINPVFGSLWRAVSSDRSNPQRDILIEAFGKQVERLPNGDRKEKMKQWLEESYNFSAEILSIIDRVPETERFPCVFLDPTVNFSQAATGSGGEADNKTVTQLTRSELLEIGRSCDPRVLRRLGGILTCLTYVENASQMPEHISRASKEQVPMIPLALSTETYNRQFWKILLHTIVPGTMLTGRAAALLAALALRLGIKPLAEAAGREMSSFRNKWNTVDIPETWAVSCLTLLLEANAAYQKELNEEQEEPGKQRSLLNDKDILLFKQLVAFKTLEYNLDTPLIARVAWTPDKSVSTIGPLVTCQKCQYPRSVTIMGPDGQCGICLAQFQTPEEYETAVNAQVARGITAESKATWVECAITSCRAQYVVYNVEDLRVRPKCHYCRFGKELAPVVECKLCLNRMIWPSIYRPPSFNRCEFVCPACTSGPEADEDIETTARKLALENTMSWLVRDLEDQETSPFTNRSPFHTISTMGTEGFMRRIRLFPELVAPLTQRRKQIRNSHALISTLKGLVASRKTAKTHCSLCFSEFRPAALALACGRRGCLQQICASCSAAWYGSNACGRIINTAALGCPFCRRLPTPRVLTKYGNGIHAVRDLTRAVQDSGTWIHAWCSGCFTAKEYMGRSCARGMPPEITDWKCESCLEELRRRDEQQAQDAEAERISKIKPCPKCGTMTEKISGCGHITCAVEECGAEWCYFCGKAYSEDQIYNHMDEVHGGIYCEDDEGGEDGDYDEDE